MADRIVPLDTSVHAREAFSCGNSVLDRYFRQQVSQDVKKRATTCFVLCDEANLVKGYITLSSLSIPKNSIPPAFQKSLALYADVPVTLLGRLAVDTRFRRQGLGEILLLEALHMSQLAAKTIASTAVVVDPIDESAVKFYKRYGFVELPDSGKMFLPMKTIEQLFAGK